MFPFRASSPVQQWFGEFILFRLVYSKEIGSLGVRQLSIACKSLTSLNLSGKKGHQKNIRPIFLFVYTEVTLLILIHIFIFSLELFLTVSKWEISDNTHTLFLKKSSKFEVTIFKAMEQRRSEWKAVETPYKNNASPATKFLPFQYGRVSKKAIFTRLADKFRWNS